MRVAIAVGNIVVVALVLLELLGACVAPLVPPMPPAPLIHRPDTLTLAATFGPHGINAYGGYGLDAENAAMFGITYASANIGMPTRNAFGMEAAIGKYRTTKYTRSEAYIGLGFDQVGLRRYDPDGYDKYSIGTAFIQGNAAITTNSQFLAQIGISCRFSYHYLLGFSPVQAETPVPEKRSTGLLTVGPFYRLGWNKLSLEGGFGLSIPLNNPDVKANPFPISIGVFIQF